MVILSGFPDPDGENGIFQLLSRKVLQILIFILLKIPPLRQYFCRDSGFRRGESPPAAGRWTRSFPGIFILRTITRGG